MSELESPADVSALYLARGDEVARLRPILQGDVFEHPGIPGVEGPLGLAAVLAHPCTMRTSGGQLRDRILMGALVTCERVPPRAWPSRHFRVQFLPELRPNRPSEHVGVDFEAIGTVSSGSLDVDRRIASLTDYGITVLQQRFVHHLTRVVVDLPTLHEQVAPDLEEADLLQEWLEDLVLNPQVDADVSSSTRAFDALLSANQGELRRQLKDPVRRANVRRRIRQEIRDRHAGT